MLELRSRPKPRLHPRGFLAVAGALALVGGVAWAASTAKAQAANAMVSQEAGTWDMAFEKGNRRCRLNLTVTSAGGGFGVMMPAGCHRAFPQLSAVTSWEPRDGGHVLLQDAAGQPVLDFGPAGGSFLAATVAENDTYTLTPTDQARQAMLAGAATAGDAIAADSPAEPAKPKAAKTPAAVSARPVTMADVAGHYAVVRFGKDTGCMVTLEDKDKGPKGGMRAKLAPACRDQGIVIFDPVAWQIARNQLVLTAKRGHTTELILQDDGTWSNNAAKGRVLVLKRL